ncbi:bifunctional metallophosphatase/5'-nucleotidase [Vibrio alginolyticus]|uniref:bifunctional metallophosphatase/5'-nucleotidase n=1 Tax=Vibrio TaxID=662 RepID=UPI001BD4B5EE|nr:MULTISPECIES: bifunctional UDP-sugar hydrolase/5'-nucleotidase [Vibrio]EJR0948649.1 bifunctional metallophosphatase/5'-nucleotidase [Vibrio alginolyticus]EKA3117785.1 bifunctional metallophosphatase/5'-nucleotidase [Vibrio alginolyticus]ELA8074811.1 bifunctional metallophosphatase/5'-nucleotidase [Vibrio alginolyticus]ELB2807945.1 bifunctional metallophosphatase/5'-nucleotidase [Vibrio alginolyticus]ELB2842265.1 bifunctional metallophosphatase/5'-nucleotidase [Vibrio alginolyticus]
MKMNNNHKPVRIKLAHINDTHSYFEPTSLQLKLKINNELTLEPYVSAGGFSRIATRVEQLRDDAQRQGHGMLFLHAGDCFQGTLYFSLFKGKANADLLNALKIDAMALGNHELDMGNEPVALFCQRTQFPLLAGNWDLSNESLKKPHRISDCEDVYSYQPDTQSAQYIVKEFHGERVAIFGLSIDKMSDIANPDADTPFHSAIETAKATVKQIHSSGIKNIILLSHLGYEGDLELAEQVAGIGIIVGGHSHRLQGDFSSIGLGQDDPYGIKINDTYVVQAGFHALTMGHCVIEFDEHGKATMLSGQNELLLGRRIFWDSTLNQQLDQGVFETACDFIHGQPNVVVCKKHPETQAILSDKYIPQVRQLQSQVIASVDTKKRHVRIPDEFGESELASSVARSFLHCLNKRGYDVQFAIHNAGGVRTSLNPGNITVADIAGRLLPFAVPIGFYDVKGSAIRRALEGAINNALNNGVEGTGSGSYPYTYNLNFEYHADAPKGERVQSLVIFDGKQWVGVQDDVWYRGTSSAYTMKGKEGYDALQEMKGEGRVTSLSMADCFIELLTDEPNCLNQSHKLYTKRRR